MKYLVPAAVVFLVAPAVEAHPHVFVETGIEVIVNAEGLATRIEMTWQYDAFFSLLILEDEGLDPDGDAVLTRDEELQLLGFDLAIWPEGFEGDLYAYRGTEKVEMPRPEPVSVKLVDGEILSRQSRMIPPMPVNELTLQQFDPTYYVAYTVTHVEVLGARCAPRLTDPDPDAVDEAVLTELQAMPEDQFEIMELGIHFAQTIELSCAPHS